MQASGVRVSTPGDPTGDGIYAIDFAGCPENLPRPLVIP
jgi:hypothetical protein